MFYEKAIDELINEIDKDITILIDEAAKFIPVKPKGLTILIRSANEHKAVHRTGFKVKNSNGDESEIFIKKGHGDNTTYGFFPTDNINTNFSAKEITYLKKFSEKNAEIIDNIWKSNKNTTEYNDYMNQLKENNKNCKVIGDLGGK